MRRFLSLILTICLCLTPLNYAFANPNKSDNQLELNAILRQADEVKLLENTDKEGKAYAILDGTKTTITWNKATNDVNLKVEEIEKREAPKESNFKIDINEDFEVSGEMNFEGENYNIEEMINLSDSEATTYVVIGLPIILGSALISALIAASATVVILGVTYVLATEVASTLRKKKPQHYQAAIRYSKKLKRDELFIGNDLEQAGAAGRLKKSSNNDVWSTTQAGAFKIAKLAGGGKNPTAYEKHGGGKPGYYWHYHIYNRTGGHSFG